MISLMKPAVSQVQRRGSLCVLQISVSYSSDISGPALHRWVAVLTCGVTFGSPVTQSRFDIVCSVIPYIDELLGARKQANVQLPLVYIQVD